MTTTFAVQKTRVHSDGTHLVSDDLLGVEEPLEMRINGNALSVTMRTPGNDDELALGFLLTEQIINSREDIFELKPLSENIISASVHPSILEGKCWLRNFYASSSCGVCGKASIEQLKFKAPIVESDFTITRDDLLKVPSRMRSAQKIFDQTGGLHAAALFDSTGDLLVLREDIGRHNAVDKVVGWAMKENRVPISDAGLFVSGRTSFEILQKAITAGFPLVAAVSAPSSLAARLANEYNVTLAGFVRGESFNVYCDPGRILSEC